MNRRWYDQDPTLSMSVSLLQNASKSDQLQTVKYIFTMLEDEHILEKYGKQCSSPMKLSYIFPFKKRVKLEEPTWRLLEILKHMPYSIQLEMALNIINYVYLLDAGIPLEDPPKMERLLG